MIFNIDYDKQPLNFLKKQDNHIKKRILDKIDDLLTNEAVPHGAISIVGEHGVYRIRVGDYRAIYRVNYQENKIIIVKLDKRENVYD